MGCQDRRVAWAKPRVDWCYECLPGGPFTPPPCGKCGSDAYFSDGLCGRCHPGGPAFTDACRGCLAWGVERRRGWLCSACLWWRTHYPLGTCPHCGRETWIGGVGGCLLCLDQARRLQEPGRAPDLAGATRHGQQLTLANMRFHRHRTPRLKSPGRTPPFTPTAWRQLVLVEVDLDPEILRRRRLAAEGGLLDHCREVLDDHGDRHGWSVRQRNVVVQSLRLLAVLQDTPGAKIAASDVAMLPRHGGNIESTLEVLEAAGLLLDDRLPRVERYFAERSVGLPEPMKAELDVWIEVMLKGSTTVPRRRARDPETVQLHVTAIMPIVRAWAEAGHSSLAEITTEQVRGALPASGGRRNLAEFGLRSLFEILKGRRLVFADPMRAIPATPVNSSVPLPLDTAAIREALDSPDPAIALAVALVAFHALTSAQLRALLLTNVLDGRLRLGEREIPLADPVLVRLRSWLDLRARTWPATVNPHLFVSRRSAPRLIQVGRNFPWTRTNLKPQALREDRILAEIHATGGDVRRICDLFGMSVSAAMRYAGTLDGIDSGGPRAPVTRTQDGE
ncbi:MAG: hypothetical protein JSU06_16485 [Actinobacteria bacterium]|nr:hypothetical protein [Actinomycetota bacterium]